jgi:hypothetical protein
MKPAGYSGTPLIQKLGIQPGMRIYIQGEPMGYAQTLGPLPEVVTRLQRLGQELDFIHYFTKERSQLEGRLPDLKAALDYTGMLWISWPKKAAKVETDVDENLVRQLGLAAGLVDVKVAAVDETWSGLKFVYRLEDRPGR